MASADEIPLAPAPVQDVPAPAASPGRTAEDAAAARSEWAAMLFVAALAGLLASFPARNNDLLIHLAAGRDLAQGRSPFGAVPEPSADPRVSHSWLYNLAAYGLVEALGGWGLVFVKVLLVV